MDNPIKKFIDDTFYVPLSSNFKAFTDVYVMASKAVLSESFYPWDPPKTISFA